MPNPAEYKDYEAFKAAVQEDCRRRQKWSARLLGRLNVTERDKATLGPHADRVITDASLLQCLMRDCFSFAESCLADGSWAQKTPEVGPLLLRVKGALAKCGVKAAFDKWLSRVCYLDERHRTYLSRYMALYEKTLADGQQVKSGSDPNVAAEEAAAETELRAAAKQFKAYEAAKKESEQGLAPGAAAVSPGRAALGHVA